MGWPRRGPNLVPPRTGGGDPAGGVWAPCLRGAGADVSLVFYAGHGIEMDGANYVVPVDARPERDVDVRYETMTLDDLLVSTTGASLRLVLLDACRGAGGRAPRA